MFKDDISIIIPCWKAKPYIVRAVVSALKYGLNAKNIFVIYDGKEQSLITEGSFFDHIRRITLINNEGAPYVRSYALSLVETRYVIFLDCDDYIVSQSPFPDFLVADIIFGNWRYSGLLNNPNEKISSDSVYDPHAILGNWMDTYYYPCHALIWNVDFLKKIGSWNLLLKKNQDGELMSRALLCKPKLKFTESHVAFYYQRHGLRVSNSNWESKVNGFVQIEKNIRLAFESGDLTELDAKLLIMRNEARKLVDCLLSFSDFVYFNRLYFVFVCFKSGKINFERILLTIFFGGKISRLPRIFKFFSKNLFAFFERLLSKSFLGHRFIQYRLNSVRTRYKKRPDYIDLLRIEPSLCRYMGFFSVSHGVDFFHTTDPFDSKDIMPVYLLNNMGRIEEIMPVKNFFLLPHVSVLSHRLSPVKSINASDRGGMPELLILPPLGPRNRVRIINFLKVRGLSHCVLLVKPRGNFDSDRSFLEESGFRCATVASSNDGFYYKQLFEFLTGFKKIHFVTISSIAFFAAYMQIEIEFHRGFFYKYIDIYGYERKLNFNSARAQASVQSLVFGDILSRKKVADDVLGAQIPYLAGSLTSFLKDQSPFEFNNYFCASQGNKFLRLLLVLITGRTVFFRKSGLKDLFLKVEVEISEIDCWLTGTTGNLDIKQRIDFFMRLRLGGI